MRKTIVLLLLPLSASFAQNPCEDQRYIELKRKPFDSMTQREYDYFMLKEKYCNEEKTSIRDVVHDSGFIIVDIDAINFQNKNRYNTVINTVDANPGVYIDAFFMEDLNRL